MNQIINQIAPIFVVLIVLALVSFRSKTTHFECPSCGSAFKTSGLRFALAPHIFNRRYVKCPNCNYSAMMDVINDKQ